MALMAGIDDNAMDISSENSFRMNKIAARYAKWVESNPKIQD